ncbi:hypothetical protein BDV98DRAFT_558466 [Pterulicium gracile]|uniref:Uncharacterized protein n=1 Tax=Pterulicium gracile TaxID=1884261 RepID=A0A5C3R451_9AGAR|nr:hypothetical protein BDV98DRAFT_558466 [Pterula gracilis]
MYHHRNPHPTIGNHHFPTPIPHHHLSSYQVHFSDLLQCPCLILNPICLERTTTRLVNQACP